MFTILHIKMAGMGSIMPYQLIGGPADGLEIDEKNAAADVIEVPISRGGHSQWHLYTKIPGSGRWQYEGAYLNRPSLLAKHLR